ncbi:beta-lactamase class A [Thermomonospora echinospora]|uniref:Beta-lactamase n=1 Tax=Thermomonospora echinospora TaxID=1992 RepID=A0A1H5T212_9ACTN|nr:class A beta-lactamase [Thermomonospora echinospora]SEF56121.1 beta-lactamase class A [Thermomonospora echinospora]
MRDVHRRWPWRGLGATALAASLLFGGVACGADTEPAGGRAVTHSGQETVRTPAVTGGTEASRQAEARRRLRELEDSYQGRIGAFAFDTGSGRILAHRAHERFPMLSTFKAVAAAAVLHKARREDPGLMDRIVRWSSEDLVDYSPITEQHVDTGLTVAQLCDAAIRYSDNTAGNLLLKQIGGPPGLTRFLRSLGDPVSRLDRWETELNEWSAGERRDTTTPEAMGRDLHRLTVGNGLAEADRRRLIGWLRGNTTGDKRIRAGLPEDWTVGDKTGTAGSAANDVAIAWPPGSSAPVIFAVYTARRDFDAPGDEQVIATTATILARGLGLPA